MPVNIGLFRPVAEVTDALKSFGHKEPVSDLRQHRAFFYHIAVKQKRHAAVGGEFVINFGVDDGRAGRAAY